MSATPKTIQIFLPCGDPRGIRIAEITARIVQMIEIPRSLLQDFLKMPESSQVAVIFLIFYCKSAGADGRGLYTPEGFVVLKDSRGHAQTLPNINASHERLRETLIENGVMHVDDKQVVFDKDHLFSAPSAAAMAVLGRKANGWTEWKSKSGTTLDELERTIPAETT